MKIVLPNVLFSFLFIIYNYLCSSIDATTIGLVGALFHEKDTQAEIPLKSALFANNIVNQSIHYKPKIILEAENDGFLQLKTICDQILSSKIGAVALIGPPTVTSCNMVQSTCSNLEIPNIQTAWNPIPFPPTTIINFYPEPNLLAKGIATIVNSLDWKSFILLYESEESLLQIQTILKLEEYNDKISSIVLKELGPGPDYRTVFKEIKQTRENFIVLDCHAKRLMNVLEQARNVYMLEKYHNYFLTSLDAHTIDFASLNTTANITTIRIFEPESEPVEQTIKNWELTQFYQGKNMELTPYSIETATALMHDATRHLIDSVNILDLTQNIKPEPLNCTDPIGKWKDGFRIISYMKIKQPTFAFTAPINFDETGKRINFTIHLVQGFRNNIIGTWNPKQPEQLITNMTVAAYQKALVQNLQAQTIIVASRLGEPYLRLRKVNDSRILEGNERYEGYSMDLISEIAEILQFKFEFTLVKDSQIGAYNEKTKEWNGLVRELLDHQADLAICDFTMTHQRRKVVDFSMPFMALGISILYKQNTKKPINMFAFLAPFSAEVWAYTATLYLTMTILLYIVYRLAPDEWENPHPCDQNPEELENIWDIMNSLWLTLGSIMAQGCDLLPKGVSSRMATSMWWFFSLIMTSSYTANLAAFLTMERGGPTIESVDDLVQQTRIKYGCMDLGATQAFFRESSYPTYEKMWTNMIASQPSVFVKNNDDGVKRVQSAKSLYAFLMESTQIEYVTKTKCNLRKVGKNLDDKFYAIAMPMRSAYVGLINSAVLRLGETGRLDELKTKWWQEERDESVCTGDDEVQSDALALENVGGVFLVLGVGVGISYFIALCEFLWNVRNLSVEEHISFREALKHEVKFALSFWITKKKTKCPTPSASSSSHSSVGKKSKTRSILKSAGSLFSLNKLHIINK